MKLNQRNVKTTIRQTPAERELFQAVAEQRGFTNYSTFVRTVLASYLIQLDMVRQAEAHGAMQ